MAFSTLRITDPHTHATAEVVPGRGALVTRFRVKSDEVLYLDEATLTDPTKNVRGGIPVLFPIAGPLPGGTWSYGGKPHALPQHGFARNLPWEVVQQDAARLLMRLPPSEATRAGFPFEFEARLEVSLQAKKLVLDLYVENRSRVEMPFQAGFHPYFEMIDALKAEARIGGGSFDLTAEVLDVNVPSPSEHGVTIVRPGGFSPLTLRWSRDFDRMVVWTLKGKNFVCVEPWIGKAGALASGDGTLKLAPRDAVSLRFEIEPG